MGKAFTPVLPPWGEDSFYRWGGRGAQRVSKDRKDTHHMHTHSGIQCIRVQKNTQAVDAVEIHTDKILHTKTQPWKHTYCLFTLFASCCIVLFHTNNVASSQANHNYRSQVQIMCKDNGKSKSFIIYSLFINYHYLFIVCAATESNGVVLLLILQ